MKDPPAMVTVPPPCTNQYLGTSFQKPASLLRFGMRSVLPTSHPPHTPPLSSLKSILWAKRWFSISKSSSKIIV